MNPVCTVTKRFYMRDKIAGTQKIAELSCFCTLKTPTHIISYHVKHKTSQKICVCRSIPAKPTCMKKEKDIPGLSET